MKVQNITGSGEKILSFGKLTYPEHTHNLIIKGLSYFYVIFKT